ncbi:hypothetical protein OG21DRAFT_1514883, partial [Imleria badia]
MERTSSIWDRYGIGYVAEAPHLLHACGLDPNVATVDDTMDHCNARLKCLPCGDSRARRWRDAGWHGHSYHPGPAARFELPRWQVVSDEHVGAIQAAELSLQKDL